MFIPRDRSRFSGFCSLFFLFFVIRSFCFQLSLLNSLHYSVVSSFVGFVRQKSLSVGVSFPNPTLDSFAGFP